MCILKQHKMAVMLNSANTSELGTSNEDSDEPVRDIRTDWSNQLLIERPLARISMDTLRLHWDSSKGPLNQKSITQHLNH